jgi:hypothetical protein
MQSSLKPGDYEPTLRSNGLYWSTGVIALFVISVVLLSARRLETTDVLLLTFLGMLIPVPVVVIIGRRRARSRRQMEWALAHL